MSAVFTIKRYGAQAVILKDGEEVWGPGRLSLAQERKDVLERQARRKRRKCMTCDNHFMSEGAHHRMCARCRNVGASAETGAV